jgi:hypothetical protein
MITRNTTVSRKESYVTAPLEKGLAMMSLEEGAYFGLDDIGAVIWDLLAEPKTVADLCTELQARYAVEPGQCEADTLAFLGELHNADMLQIIDSDDS